MRVQTISLIVATGGLALAAHADTMHSWSWESATSTSTPIATNAKLHSANASFTQPTRQFGISLTLADQGAQGLAVAINTPGSIGTGGVAWLLIDARDSANPVAFAQSVNGTPAAQGGVHHNLGSSLLGWSGLNLDVDDAVDGSRTFSMSFDATDLVDGDSDIGWDGQQIGAGSSIFFSRFDMVGTLLNDDDSLMSWDWGHFTGWIGGQTLEYTQLQLGEIDPGQGPVVPLPTSAGLSVLGLTVLTARRRRTA